MKSRPHKPFLRQLGFFDPRTMQPKILLIGAGGIGCPTALALTRLGVQNLAVFDADTIDTHNVSTTMYRVDQVGQSKVSALGKLVKQFGYAENHFAGYPEWFRRTIPLKKLPWRPDMIISGVDSVEARKEIFGFALKHRIPVLIDGRIGGEHVRVYTVDMLSPKERRAYLKSLPRPEQIMPLPCNSQQVWDIGGLTASLIVRAVRKAMHREYIGEVIVRPDLTMLMATPKRLKRRIKWLKLRRRRV